MYIRPERDHNLVHVAAKQCVHAQLEALAHPDLLGQEVVALIGTVELLIRAVAVRLVRLADLLAHAVYQLRHILFRRSGAHGHEGFEEVPEPAEGDVVLGDLLEGVPGDPGIDTGG